MQLTKKIEKTTYDDAPEDDLCYNNTSGAGIPKKVLEEKAISVLMALSEKSRKLILGKYADKYGWNI